MSENHFETTTGYGYNDLGRDTLEAVYAEIFGTEDALVRPQLILREPMPCPRLCSDACAMETVCCTRQASPMIPCRV